VYSKMKYRLKLLNALKPYAYGVKRFVFLNLLIGVAMMGLGFIQPLFYKLFIHRVILGQELFLMITVAIAYISIHTVNWGLTYLKNYSTNRLVNRVTFRVKMKILQGFFHQEFTDYEHQSVGDMKMRMDDDTTCISAYAGAQTVDYILAYITMLLSAVFLFIMEWRLALFSYLVIPTTLWIDHTIAKREAVVLDKQRENDQAMSSWLHASVQGWKEIKALNLQKHEERRFADYIHTYAIFFGRWINYWVARALVIPKIKDEFLMQFSLYFFGGLLIIGGHFEIASLLVFMQYYGILSNALNTVSGADAELLTTRPQSDRMLKELSRAYKHKKGLQEPGAGNNIELREVSFRYPGSEQFIIEKLSFHIREGERVGLVGKSGAGKTTVLKLMTGLLKPVKGTVLFSGYDVAKLSLEAMHHRIGFVQQENILFHGSIRENLYYGKSDATDAELIEACKKAYIYDYINTLPNRFETILGERGIKLSGGQKQRIVLARLFLRDVKVFIFDEATSALDQYSENIIQDAIKSIGRDRTIIVVAHRESSLALCDRIIEL
jgi:ABC-type bacteriocin/lantibiotic exporter with double-glycine peptidase domain